MMGNGVRERHNAELTSMLADTEAELFNRRFQDVIKQMEKPGRIEAIEEHLGRVMTFLAGKQ